MYYDSSEKDEIMLEKNVPYEYIYEKDGRYFSLKDKILEYKSLFKFYSDTKTILNYQLEPSMVISLYLSNKPPKQEIYKKIKKYLDDIRLEGLNTNIRIEQFNEFIIDDTLKRFNKAWEHLLLLSNKKYQNFKENLDFLGGLKELESYEMIKESLVYSNVKQIHISDTFLDINEENGIILFNTLYCTEYIPYIRYKNYIKIYESNFDEKYIIPYETPFKSDEEDDDEEATIQFRFIYKKNDYIFKIYLDSNLFEYSYSEGKDEELTEKVILSIFRDTYNNVIYGKEFSITAKGLMKLNFPGYNEANFYYMIMTNRHIKNLIYANDFSKAHSLRNFIKYYYRKPSFIRTNDAIDYSGTFRMFSDEKNKLVVEFTFDVNKISEILNMGLVLSKLHTIYENTNFYEIFGIGNKFERITTKRAYKKITHLKQLAPELFENASKVCTCTKQPIIIDEEDIEDWKQYSKDILTEGERQVFSFLGYNFVCPDDHYPYPYVKRRDKKNMNKDYPLVPCCRIHNFLDSDEGKQVLEEYSKDKEKFVSEKKGITTLEHEKLSFNYLSPLQIGLLPDIINIFLKNIYKEVSDFKRIGVSEDVDNCLLHCILSALGDISHNKIVQTLITTYKKDKEAVIQFVRRALSDMNLNLCKMENYDKSLDEIQKDILGKTIDSRLYYRLLEEFFEINLFVLRFKDEKFCVETPKYKIFNVRNIDYSRKCVLLYKHESPVDLYEIITAKHFKNNDDFTVMSIGGRKVGLGCYGKKLNKKIDEIIKMRKHYVNKEDAIHLNPYFLDFSKIFEKVKILSQVLDSSGKLYRVNISFPLKSYSSTGKYNSFPERLTIYVPPSPPLNTEIDETIYVSNEDVVISLFGNKMSRGVDGLWYKINGIECMFVPCKLNKIEKNAKECKKYILDNNKDKVNEYYNSLINSKKYANILLQLIVWIWRVSGSMSINSFIKTYFEENDEPIELPNYIPNVLPNLITVEDCIDYLSDYWYTVFSNKIYLNKDIIENLEVFLIRLEENTRGLSLLPKKTLFNNLNYSRDFIHSSENKVFTSDESFNVWFLSNINKFIVKNINFKTHEIENYFIFKNNNFYIVEGVGELRKSLEYLLKRDVYDTEDESYVVYEKDFILIKDNRKNEFFLELYLHENGFFSALKRI